MDWSLFFIITGSGIATGLLFIIYIILLKGGLLLYRGVVGYVVGQMISQKINKGGRS